LCWEVSSKSQIDYLRTCRGNENATWNEEGPEDGKFSDDKSDDKDENHSEAENDSCVLSINAASV